MLNIHERFQFFASSQDVGHEKPDSQIFAEAFRQAQFWLPDLERDEVLHVGDSLACDFCGARAFGFQALVPVWKSNSGRPCHRRNVVSVAASARWCGVFRPSTRRCCRDRDTLTHWLISTQVVAR